MSPHPVTSEKDGGRRITDLTWRQESGNFILQIHGEEAPTYTSYELFDPLRVIIDVANAVVAGSVPLNMSPAKEDHKGIVPVKQVKVLTLADKKPFITRFEIFLARDRSYSVERQGNNIAVIFPAVAEAEQEGGMAAGRTEAGNNGQPLENKPDAGRKTLIKGIEVASLAAGTRVYIRADGPVDYKYAELPKVPGRSPDLMYIDIKNAAMTDLQPLKELGGALARIRTARRGNGVRIVFDSGLPYLFTYHISSQPDGLLVMIDEPSTPAGIIAGIMNNGHGVADDENQTPLQADKAPVESDTAAAGPRQDPFGFAGYNRQRITVDFYKIDLHNVFRLFGEISGLNIVVDESVNGSLTLALNDVPWDFALDIILNLKDLKKEERFNTIVISPASKQFSWPKQATDNLAFSSSGHANPREAIIIKKRLQPGPGETEARGLLRQARELEKNEDYSGALSLYEQAFLKWPDEALAVRIASDCLVRLKMNAKAVHYAKAALKINPGNYDAALAAAIGLANMKMTRDAEKYFDLAVSGKRPASEALISNAAFCEENGRYDAAMAQLARHEQIYGDSLETMIAKARLYDKQGDRAAAVAQYRAIILSGFDVPPDLKRYINGRIALIPGK